MSAICIHDLVKRRDQAVCSLRRKIATWIEENASERGHFDGRKIVELARYVGGQCSEEVSACTALFAHWQLYPEQPNVLVFGTPGTRDLEPDVYIMGWRPCDERQCSETSHPEGTAIHDHDNSRAAIFVVEGAVKEVTFTVNSSHSADSKMSKREQILRAGETKIVGAPEIHDVHNASRLTAVTVHVYYPPLEGQNVFEIVDGKLVATGRWEDVIA